MKDICVIFYHKNAFLFKPQWIRKCIESIKQQTFNDFDVLELNYDQTNKQLFEGSIFENKILTNHVKAMNHLIEKARNLGYKYIFNTNIDDYYSINRIEEQMKYLKDYDMVSSDHECIKEKNGTTIVISSFKNSSLDVKENLIANNNIIPHPCTAWNVSFFDDLSYENEIPEEDMRLWQRALKNNKTIFIVPKVLLYYRIHDNQITQMTQKTNQTIMGECILDFLHCFEKSTKTFLRWSDIMRIFKSWWLKFHSEKKLPTDYDVRKIMDSTLGDPIPRRGWFIKMRSDYEW